jgi:hypothetical protein
MPVGDFTAALTERVHYAVFLAYETWARETAYTAHNPYDVLARLLNGLPQALSTAMAERGGWVTLAAPAGGTQNGDSRVLINEMAGQVMAARIQAEAADVPDIGLLTGLIVDAVSGAITLFIEQPGSFDLARAEEASNAPLGTRTMQQATAEATANSEAQPAELSALPEAPHAASIAPGPHVPATTKAWLARLLEAFLRESNPGSPLIVLGTGGETMTLGQDGQLDLIDLDSDWHRPENVVNNGGTHQPGPDLPKDGLVPDLTGLQNLTQVEREAFLRHVEAMWTKALDDARFFHVEAGVYVELAEAKADVMADMLVAAAVAAAERDLFGIS